MVLTHKKSITYIFEEHNCLARYLVFRENSIIACNTKHHIIDVASDLLECFGCF